MIKDAAPKHPASEKWYWFEWSSIELQGASVVANTWTLPVGITKDNEAISGTMVGIKLSGGTLDADYEIEWETSTDTPEKLNESALIRIRKSGH